MSADDFFRELQEDMLGGVYTSAIARIEKYDPVKNKADIVLEPSGALIQAVPVGIQQTDDFFFRIPYEKGNLVIVVFSHGDISPITFDTGAAPSKTKLGIDNAMIVSGLNLFTDPLPEEHANDVVIGKKDLSCKIVIDANNNITIESDSNVFLGNGAASEGIPLGNQLKAWLDNHTHPGAHGETGPPSNESPPPSSVVKTV